MPDLRQGQYKRLGRIAENNPERAEKVAARMEKRASRVERGKEIASKSSRDEDGRASSLERHISRAEAPTRQTKRVEAVRSIGRDYPLSTTPEPTLYDIDQEQIKESKMQGRLRGKVAEASAEKKPTSFSRTVKTTDGARLKSSGPTNQSSNRGKLKR